MEMDKDAAYKAEIMSKETRIKYLARQNEEYKKMYDELWSKYSSDEQEVKVYNRLITPEVDRISRLTGHISVGKYFLITLVSGDPAEEGSHNMTVMERWTAPPVMRRARAPL